MTAKPKLDFKLDPAAMGKPQGPPAMPEGESTEVVLAPPRPNAITALAASAWAPLVAVGGHKQVLLYNTETKHLCGVLPFPEGTIYSLKFTRDGGILLVGGGRGAERGLAVGFDVKTGKRLFEVGKEYDVVLASDLSPDHSLVALGGPAKLVRVYHTSDGELAYECKKHTEWVTAVEFSPDGVLLASGDRNGGLIVWEASTGREFQDLRGHNAMITDLSWRLDGNVLASASEDGSVRLWEMENGKNIKNWRAHGGGAESVRFAKDGRLVSTGRDRTTKLWDQNGGQKRAFEAFNDIGLRIALTFDDKTVIAGDWSGEVRLWNTENGQRLGNLVANPPPLAARIEQAKQVWTTAQAAADKLAQELATLQTDAAAKTTALATAQKSQADAAQAAAKAAQDLAAAEQKVAELRKTVEAARAAVNPAKAAVSAAQLAKAAADKAVADKTPAATAAATPAASLKADFEALVAEKQKADATPQP